tara:strand:+ start:730 stop:963 length:234 start_codon:yes stop_codon:yes gene_type:complete
MVKKTILTLLLFVFVNVKCFTQCAMCKSVVESNLESGDAIGSGLNDGILFLMSMPYLAFFLFCLMFYFQNKKRKAIN